MDCVTDCNGTKIWFQGNYIHRDELHAIEYLSGRKEWWKSGNLHRDNDLPAVEWPDGTKEWYWHGKRDRELGPAFVTLNYEAWYCGDEKHRKDGHAVQILIPEKRQKISEWWHFGTLIKREIYYSNS